MNSVCEKRRKSSNKDGLQLGVGDPLYAQVRRKLEDEIGNMPEGEKLPSERILADRLKLGRVTIRRAMLDLAKEGFVVRHPGLGTFVGKTLHVGASDKVAAKEIALVVPSVELTCHADIIKGIHEQAAREYLNIAVYDCLLDNKREHKIIESLIGKSPSGVILLPFFEDSFNKQYVKLVEKIKSNNIPLILIEQYLPECRTRVVMPDNHQIGYIATEHLIMLGHKKICFVSTGNNEVPGRAHLAGYRAALNDYGIDFNPELSIEFSIKECAKPTERAIISILKKDPYAFTAIATPQFSMTHGIVKAFKKLGIKTPQDIALVGAEVHQNPELENITHVIRNNKKMGMEAIKMLTASHKNNSLKKHILLPPELIIRESCGARL